MGKEATGQLVVRLILRHFAGLRDPRSARTRKYALQHVLAMALCSVLMGADGFKAMALFVADRRALFEEWLGADFGEGTPCADTFRRVFAALCPQGFERAFRLFIQQLSESLRGQVVAFDGKAVRGALQPAGGPLYLVHAWAAEQRLLLAQARVEGAPGEVAGLVELIDALALEGAVVTADANGCTEGVAAACTRARADYVLCLKGNRGPLRRFAAGLFILLAWQGGLPQQGVRRMRREEGWRHGRFEVREAWALSPRAWPCSWPGLRTLVLVRRERHLKDGRVEVAWHTYVSSLPPHAKRLAHAIRRHWGVENGLHWSLDAQMGEDRRRVREARAAENLALLTRLALVLLKQDKSVRLGVALKRAHAARNDAYLLHLLKGGLPST
ncbi:ISAs1 family transposase [Aggregicoccus sp. 17bor-14]|uniref:ISAs1 family transposase n=1 Tax=Myxococcaceae TaxID=31 RepID=UPI00129CD76E|nr:MULTISPECIES: ISAs1 family transposase [Myxococcaceae]MBF5045720.1 ISAs1 family transposase [Simulacricoccus sp. 17bor-14]MRI91456.1 ISAs1 family transposase [Aggregicoccus sp. 17bor-14]